MKYLIIKGAAGLANRLYTLSYCLEFAKKHNLYLIVDWRDWEWSDNKEIGFDTYFDIKYDKYISDINKLTELNELTTFPSPWKGHLDKFNVVKGKKWDYDDSNKGKSVFIRLHDNIKQDVIIYYSYLTKGPLINFLLDNTLILKSFLIKKIKYNKILLTDSNLGVHIRCSDIRASNLKNILVTLVKYHKNYEVILLGTDNKDIQKQLKDKYNNIITLSDLPNLPKLERGTFGVTGIHRYLLTNEGKDFLKNNNTNKHKLVCDAIIDLFTLSQCKNFIGSHGSTFSQLIQYLIQNQYQV